MDLQIVYYAIDEALYAASRYFQVAVPAFLVFYWVLRRPMAKRKIQSANPTWSKMMSEIILSMISVGIFGLVAAVSFNVLGDMNHVYRQWDELGAAYYFLSFFLVLFLHDTYFYWIHRLMHTRFLYRHVHAVHHRSTNPTPWTAYSFHPLEALLEAGILPLIAFGLPVHYSVVVICMLAQIIYNVYAHLGYELYPRGFHRTSVGRYINTSVAHNQHHSRFHGNYGLYFLVWDRLMGTLRRDYDQGFERVGRR